MQKPEKTEIKKNADVFFSVLRSALGTGEACRNLNLSVSQWRKLYRVSVVQGVGALVFDEISGADNNMPESLFDLWKEYSDISRKRFDMQLIALNHLTQVLEDNGIHLMVLKGIGLSLLYPIPQERECCDIDIYCFGEYEHVNSVLVKSGLIKGIDGGNDKHCSFTFDGVTVENHRYFSEYVNRANIAIGKEILSLSSGDFLTDSRLPGICFPSPQMGILHLMMHTLSHLAWSGINMRHLIDWGLYVRKYGKVVDWKKIVALWNDTDILYAVNIIHSICHKKLGLDFEIPDLHGQADISDIHFVTDSILHPLRKSVEVWDPLRKFLRKFHQYETRKRMHMLVYNEPFPDSFLKSFAFFNITTK